jgi:hypothetical protein
MDYSKEVDWKAEPRRVHRQELSYYQTIAYRSLFEVAASG